MISALTLEEIDIVSGGVDPFCPDGFRVGTINYNGQGEVTGWTCVSTSGDGGTWYGSVADWAAWAAQKAIELVVSFF